MDISNIKYTLVAAFGLAAIAISCTSDSATNQPPALSLPNVLLEPALSELPGGLPGLSPIMARPLPGTDSLAIADQSGFIDVVDGSEIYRLLELGGLVRTQGDEEGLLGFDFHPDFDTQRQVFVYYSASSPRRSVISRFDVPLSPGPIDLAGETIFLEVEQPFSNHNGGMIEFGPDGYLYIAFGDGGSGGDSLGHAQNLDSILGSLIRIDVTSADGIYAIPSDNPYVSTAGRAEIWAHGLRNPWRFSFDQDTGVLWLGDVGEKSVEEIDVVERGGNYGWNIFEGDQCFGSGECDTTGFIEPVITYDTSVGCAVTGGYVYRGNQIPDLRGAYVYGDFCTGMIWFLRGGPDTVSQPELLIQGPAFISSFAEDAQGELLVLSFSAGVQRIVPR